MPKVVIQVAGKTVWSGEADKRPDVKIVTEGDVRHVSVAAAASTPQEGA